MRLVHLAFGIIALALPFGAPLAQVTYNGGRSGGPLVLYSGDSVRFEAGVNVTPDGLWLSVAAGQGNAILRDGSGHQTGADFFLHTGDLLYLQGTPPYTLYFQGGAVTLLFGGTVANIPPKPICGVGLPVPVLLKATKALNILAQTALTGSPALGVTAFQTNQAAQSGDLNYVLVGGAKELGSFGLEVCGGGGCCDPRDYAFAIRNLSGGTYTLYEVAPLASFTFDWNAALPPPLACQASAAPVSGTAPLAVSFTATAQGGSPPYSWKWNFGDGATSTQKNPSHTYHGAGTYKWKVTLTDMAAATLQKSGQIQVTGALSVTASAAPRSGGPPLAVAFTATPKGGVAPYSFDWDFGDGTLSLEQNPVHDFQQAGQYDCRVTVADSQARAAMATASVYVGIPIPPQVSDVKVLTNPFRLKLVGTDFQDGCEVTLGGVPCPLAQFKNDQKVVLKKGQALKDLVPRGTSVDIVVTNPDGGISDPYPFTR